MRPPECHAGGSDEMAVLSRTGGFRCCFGLRDVSKDAPRPLQVMRISIRQAHGTFCALMQLDAEMGLEVGDETTYGRGHNAKTARRCGKAFGLRDVSKGT